ncbi:hypothetical protein [Sphaerimonospora thailandensis]|uniref:Leucine rich repeat (LRR) protein n=1 Tax=Sphaerimonospora thailandensis TaxID=795644 RepID=A0A8J3VYI0_9ACTN|nr:hypothetical protein [Sphaerimonospora thailandensis]GIH70069.1 hypothetical protein Mth01_23220 [Sphaerimonospora thailandensis]
MINSVVDFLALRFSDNPSDYRRAARESAPLEVWRELVRHHPEAHFWVAHNKTVPVEILHELSSSSDWRTRLMVASKNKATREILDILARDSHEAVRQVVAGHHNTSIEVLEVLCGDEWDQIRNAAQENLDSRNAIENIRD